MQGDYNELSPLPYVGVKEESSVIGRQSLLVKSLPTALSPLFIIIKNTIMSTDIQKINDEVSKELANTQTLQTLVDTTFKGLKPEQIKLAMVEGYMRGFVFQDFLEKNVYAIPYGDKYSLVTSIDYARKVGMKSGVVGKNAPEYEEKDSRIIACSITIKRKVKEDIGEFTAKVYFSEYTTGLGLWTKKPRTMIAKVAEMHALRMACPEELSQMYTAEEMGEKGEVKLEPKPAPKLDLIDIEAYSKKLESCKTIDDLKREWSAIPAEGKKKLAELKDHIKATLTPKA